MNAALTILQAGIYRRFSITAVNIGGKFKIIATSNDIENSKSLWKFVI